MTTRHLSLSNQFLIAMPTLADPIFFHSVTYLCEHTPEGALGIVINHPANISLQDVLEHMDIDGTSAALANQAVYVGGPIHRDRGFVIHQPHGAWSSSLRMPGDIGITTSHGRRHEALEKVLAKQPFDFVQFTYNVADREAEARLLPLAAERGIAVIINRPFQGGDLFDAVRGKALPPWAAECDCANWAQFFLKFIVSHPAVTCAIPATTRVDHMIENMGAARGRLPDAALRARMLAHFNSL